MSAQGSDKEILDKYEKIILMIRSRASHPGTLHDMSMAQSPKFKIYPRIHIEQIYQAGKELRFALPELLQALYLSIGNGGFGPGYGLLGIQGGYTDFSNQSLIDLYNKFHTGNPGIQLPDKVLPVVTWGHYIYSCINCSKPDYPILICNLSKSAPSGQGAFGVFVTEDGEVAWTSSAEDERNQRREETGSDSDVRLFQHRKSFEEWLEAWANGVDLWEEMTGIFGGEQCDGEVERVLKEFIDDTAEGLSSDNSHMHIDMGIEPDHIELGNENYNSENYEEAISHYDKAIELNPEDAVVFLNRGKANASLNKFEEAVTSYDRAIYLVPDNIDAYYNRGLSFAQLGKHEKALKDFNKTIEINPQNSKPYLSRALSYRNLGKLKEAVSDYDRMIELDPEDASAYFNRGYVYDDLNNHEQAIKDLNRAIQLDPKYSAAYLNRGYAYYRLGNNKLALKDYNRAIELKPDLTRVYMNRGVIYKETGRFQEAVNDFNRVAELKPDWANTYYHLAVCHEELKDGDAAWKNYEILKNLNPEMAEKLRDQLS